MLEMCAQDVINLTILLNDIIKAAKIKENLQEVQARTDTEIIIHRSCSPSQKLGNIPMAMAPNWINISNY